MAGTTIPEGATLKAKWFASDGAILRLNGSVLESYPIADLYAAIQAAITDGTIPIIINGKQLTIDGTTGVASGTDP